VSVAPKGTYFVRIGATDTDDVSAISTPVKVMLTTGTVRVTATKVKHGSAFRVLNESPTALGGDCILGRDTFTHTASVLCASATVTLGWRWHLRNGERIEKVSFAIEAGLYGCHRRVGHTSNRSTLRVFAPPTSICTVVEARITYSYPVPA